MTAAAPKNNVVDYNGEWGIIFNYKVCVCTRLFNYAALAAQNEKTIIKECWWADINRQQCPHSLYDVVFIMSCECVFHYEANKDGVMCIKTGVSNALT